MWYNLWNKNQIALRRVYSSDRKTSLPSKTNADYTDWPIIMELYMWWDNSIVIPLVYHLMMTYLSRTYYAEPRSVRACGAAYTAILILAIFRDRLLQ